MDYLPELVLVCFITRLLVTGASVGDALALFSICLVYAGHRYLKHIKEPVANKDLWDRVASLEDQFKSTKDAVNSIKLGTQLKR